ITEPDATLQNVRDLSVLALGRLMLENGDLVGSVNEYQRVSRFSTSYDVALYEMAWAYIKGEQYDKALNTIDSLLLTVKDPELDVEAHTLRGRLNIYLNDYESASETFDAIVARFAPIRNELAKFTRDPENIQRYFEWLLERESPTAKLRAPLTKRTADWVESSEDMARISAIFRDLSLQKQEVKSTQDIAKLLEKIVKSRNRVELFPGLKDGWAKTLVLENQLLGLSSNILDHQSELARRWLEPDEQGQLDSMLDWRRELERRLSKLPRTFEQYEEREERVAEKFLDLKRQSFVIGQRVRDIERQILALENYINDRQYNQSGDRFSDAKEDEFRAALENEKRRLVALQREFGRLEARLDVESHSVGAGDEAGQGDANLKRAVIESHKREGLFYDRTAVRSGKETGGHFRVLGDRRERIWQAMTRLTEIVAAIDLKVGEKVAELHDEIKREKKQIRRYERELSRYRVQGRQISQQIGSALFQKARDQMKQVVLKADVGLIDVAWQMKIEKVQAIRKVNRERSGKLSRLRRNLDEMTRDRIAAPPIPEAPAKEEEGKPESAPAAEMPPAAEGAPAEEPAPETNPEPAEGGS
ncbi:MAG: hypothetical protein VX938_11165, partial [Myxococcota bacterium]|nr:hypothetical protein [Myxococcota bacterium]